MTTPPGCPIDDDGPSAESSAPPPVDPGPGPGDGAETAPIDAPDAAPADTPDAAPPSAGPGPAARTLPPPVAGARQPFVPPASDLDTAPSRGADHRRRMLPVITLLTAALLAAGGIAWYLHDTARAWQDRAEEYLEVSLDLGDELASTRADLAGAQAELDAVRTQLGTLQTRLVELANEKARLGDDWEIQLQHLDYQERVSEAAGQVALALDQCVRGQNDLIVYLRNADNYDPDDLDQFAVGVQELCDQATEANISLQLELSR